MDIGKITRKGWDSFRVSNPRAYNRLITLALIGEAKYLKRMVDSDVETEWERKRFAQIKEYAEYEE